MDSSSRPEESAYLLRVISKSSVCVLLQNGPGVVVQADLRTPMSPRAYVAAQSINGLNSVPAKIALRKFDADNCKFYDCSIDVDIPEPSWKRVDYLARKKRQ